MKINKLKLSFCLFCISSTIIFMFLGSINYISKYKSDKNKIVPVEKAHVSFFEKEDKILSGKYNFNYEVSGKTSAFYSGTYDNGLVKGIFKKSGKTENYTIKNGEVSIIRNNQKKPYKDLYSNLDYRVFNVRDLFNYINNKNYIISEQKNTKKRICNYLNYKVEIIEDEKNIKNIIFSTDDIKYSFIYNY